MTAFNMQRGAIFILSVMIVEVASRCHNSPTKSEAYCHFSVKCYGDIRDVMVTGLVCQNLYKGSSSIDLTIENPDDSLTDGLNHTHDLFLDSVTSLKISGGIPSNLYILDHMKSLKDLNFAHNGIKNINGTPFHDMYNLEKIDLSFNELSYIDELFQFNFVSVRFKILLLHHNNIKQLSGLTFGELLFLVELDLSNNLISDLQEEPFMNLTSLEVLRLDHNRITHLNGAFNNLYRLTHLSLSDNYIEHVDESSLRIIEDLGVLDMSGNKLTEVNPIMLLRHWAHIRVKSDSNQVCRIRLSNNSIKTIPNASYHEMIHPSSHSIMQERSDHKVCSSTELDLSHNNISYINYNAFYSFDELTDLDLSKNELHDFYVNSHDLQFVKKLNLSFNEINKIDEETFAIMRHLEHLDLSHNKLDYIPDQVFGHTERLMELNMAHNSINEISIQNGKDLRIKTLILRSNSIKDPEFIDLSNQLSLNVLDLSNNIIESLTETSLKLPSMINDLNLGHNHIKSIAPGTFKHLRHLQILDLNSNSLEKLEYGTFQHLSLLRKLDLSFNQIKFLDSKVMIELKFLNLLDLQNNGMLYLDYTVWLGHKFILTVYVDGNKFSCEWLGIALNNYNKGYSKMKLMALHPSLHHSSLDGVACEPSEVENIERQSSGTSEDRLLVLVQKLLQAVHDQTLYLRKAYPMKIYQPIQSSDKNAIDK